MEHVRKTEIENRVYHEVLLNGDFFDTRQSRASRLQNEVQMANPKWLVFLELHTVVAIKYDAEVCLRPALATEKPAYEFSRKPRPKGRKMIKVEI